MPIALSALLLLALLVSPAVSVAGSTDLETFERRVQKSAPAPVIDTTPPVVCVCQENLGFFGLAGQLMSFRVGTDPIRILVRCAVLEFDPAGDVGFLIGACGLFTVLPK